MSQRLALFDLDNTLLAGDSDHAWGEFVISQGLVEEAAHRAMNDAYYQQYLEGNLDMPGYVRFTLQPILNLDSTQRQQLHQVFMRQTIEPMILDAARNLVRQHQQAGDYGIVITATNEFITTPIAQAFGIETLLATDLKCEQDRLTGEIDGIPCYQQGKVEKLQQWLTLSDPGLDLDLESACFYTDSINDISLLERVAEPVAVDPDNELRHIARLRGWKIISLR